MLSRGGTSLGRQGLAQIPPEGEFANISLDKIYYHMMYQKYLGTVYDMEEK